MSETLEAQARTFTPREDAETTRHRILAAAAHLFRTRGFRGTTTRAISEIVGILSGSLFHYFKSKDQMLFEVMHEAASTMCSKADAIMANEKLPLRRLSLLIRAHLEMLLTDETTVLVFEWRELKADVKPPITELRRHYFAIWYSVLDECRRLGFIRTDPHTTHLILHGALSWPATWFNPAGPVTLEQYANTLEQLILGAPDKQPELMAPG